MLAGMIMHQYALCQIAGAAGGSAHERIPLNLVAHALNHIMAMQGSARQGGVLWSSQ